MLIALKYANSLARLIFGEDMIYSLDPWLQILYKTLMRLVMGMASRVLDNSLKADSTFFCSRWLLNSSGYWYCYTSVSSQIILPAIGYVKDTAEYIDITKQRTISSIIKLQTHNRQSGIFCGHIYIHTNKHPRIAA